MSPIVPLADKSGNAATFTLKTRQSRSMPCLTYYAFFATAALADVKSPTYIHCNN